MAKHMRLINCLFVFSSFFDFDFVTCLVFELQYCLDIFAAYRVLKTTVQLHHSVVDQNHFCASIIISCVFGWYNSIIILTRIDKEDKKQQLRVRTQNQSREHRVFHQRVRRRLFNNSPCFEILSLWAIQHPQSDQNFVFSNNLTHDRLDRRRWRKVPFWMELKKFNIFVNVPSRPENTIWHYIITWARSLLLFGKDYSRSVLLVMGTHLSMAGTRGPFNSYRKFLTFLS